MSGIIVERIWRGESARILVAFIHPFLPIEAQSVGKYSVGKYYLQLDVKTCLSPTK